VRSHRAVISAVYGSRLREPTDPVGVNQIYNAVISADGKTYANGYIWRLERGMSRKD